MTSSYRQGFRDIENLCFSQAPESELLLQLAAILSEHPNAVNERDIFLGKTLLHHAAGYRSPEFCQLLIEIDSDLVKMKNVHEQLPLHEACRLRNFETAKYLLRLYPESINIPDDYGFYPLHSFWSRTMASDNSEQGDDVDLVKFLLKHDRGAISTVTPHLGQLPLHLACRKYDCINIVKLVYDAYPEAIHIMHYNGNGRTPLHDARCNHDMEVVNFFETQLAYECQARELLAPDMNWQLPIHRAVQNVNISLGTIKLMLAANPNSIVAVDNQGCTPLHLACRAGDIDKVKYLVEVNEGTLQICNERGEYPLQVARQYGRCDIINFILEKSEEPQKEIAHPGSTIRC